MNDAVLDALRHGAAFVVFVLDQSVGRPLDLLPALALPGGFHQLQATGYALGRVAHHHDNTGIRKLLEKGIDLLRPGGRMAIIAFHSLEAKRVKAAFRGAEKDGRVSLLTRKPLLPTRAEVADNPRSRSAVLRGVLRLDRSGGGSPGERDN